MNDRVTLLLLPGLLCNARLWAHQCDALADIAQVHVADFTTQDSISRMAEDVLAAAPERFALAGLSMGGYVAMEIMRRAPERVLRLALLDTSGRADTGEQRERRRGLIELAEKGRFRGVTPRLLPLLIHPDRVKDEALTQTVMTMAEEVGRDAFLRQQKAILGRQDSRPGLREISVPTLVVVGRQDAITPLEVGEEINDLVPGAEFEVIERCGHLSPLERPETTTVHLRNWLNG